jgi:hypothetical protein
VRDQGDKEQHKENHKQDLGDSGRGYGDAGEAQDCRNQRDNKEGHCPVQHLKISFPESNADVKCRLIAILKSP